MFLKYKAKKAVRKIANGASSNEIKNAVGDVVSEASRQLSKRVSKFNYRLPVKVILSR